MFRRLGLRPINRCLWDGWRDLTRRRSLVGSTHATYTPELSGPWGASAVHGGWLRHEYSHPCAGAIGRATSAQARTRQIMNATDRPASFFLEMLGTHAKREVNVSRAFASCFSTSEAFRTTVLKVICRACGVKPRVASAPWRCETEVHTSAGRPDIRLVPHDPRTPTLILENKVAAPLTKGQLLGYCSTDRRARVVAVTRRYPEVGRRWLRINRCASVRWQEIHKALGAVPRIKGADRFLCEAFRSYLEELDMAHREDITLADVAKVNKLVTAISSKRNSWMVADSALRTGADLLALLDQVLRGARDEQRAVEKWAANGPMYIKWHEPDGPPAHHFSFKLLKRGLKEWFGAGFMFVDGEAFWVVQGKIGGGRPFFHRQYKIERVCAKTGVLDPERMLRLYLAGLKASGLLPVGRQR